VERLTLVGKEENQCVSRVVINNDYTS